MSETAETASAPLLEIKGARATIRLNRPKHLNQGVERLIGRPKPAQKEPKGHTYKHRQRKTPRDSEQRGHDVFQQQPLPCQLDDPQCDLPGSREQVVARQSHGHVPEPDQHQGDQQRK